MPKKTTRSAPDGATIPAAMLLRLLRRALDEGAVKASDVRALLGPRSDGRKITPGPILAAARAEADRHQLSQDGLRFLVQHRSTGFVLVLVHAKTGRLAASKIHEPFRGLADLPSAADTVVNRYLLALCGEGPS